MFISCSLPQIKLYHSRSRDIAASVDKGNFESKTKTAIIYQWTLANMVICFDDKIIHSDQYFTEVCFPLQWRHNERYGVPNHQPHDCFIQPFIQAQIKENIKATRHWPLWGEFPVTVELPAQRAASNAENASIWWRQHVVIQYCSVSALAGIYFEQTMNDPIS